MSRKTTPGSVPNALPRIDLRQILYQLCQEFMSSGGFQMVEIHQWDKENDQAISLADVSQVTYIKNEGERFSLDEFPTTAGVLASGKLAVIEVEMPDAETAWMSEYGLTSLLLAPLYEKDKVIGLLEIASSDRTLLSNRTTIDACKKAIREASEWIKSPLNTNSREELLGFAKLLKRLTRASSCGMSNWLPESNEAVVVLENSSAFWELGAGPRFPLSDWMSARRVLDKNLPTVLTASDPDLLTDEREELDENKSLTRVIVPLTIGTLPIGLIDLSDMENERSIAEKELFTWGGIAGQAALAIQNAQLMDLAQEVLDEQTALRKSIEVISSTVERDVILNGLAEQIGKSIDATAVFINEFQGDQESYRAEACFISRRGVDAEGHSVLHKPYSLVAGTSFRKRLKRDQFAQLNINDADISENDREHMESHGSKSRLYIPIYLRDTKFGFAEIWESRSIREFTQSEIDLCNSMCLQAAVAIENAKLLEFAQAEVKLRRQFEERLKHEALHDPLTRLPNRRLFIDRLEQSILRRSRKEKSDFAVLYFDLDKFKWVNDSFGHQGGDRVLVQVAECIRDCIRRGDTAARFGGDEFLILIIGDNDPGHINRVCSEIQSRLRSMITVDGRRIPMSASIGVAMSTEEPMSADDYINRADIAMYEAKSSGGSHIKKFTPDAITVPVHNLDLRAEIRDAVAGQAFTINYQPIVKLDTREVASVEALLRWKRPGGEIIPPSKFVPVVEDLRLMTDLGFWVIDSAVSQFRKWQTHNSQFAQVSLSLNLSISQITDTEFIDRLKEIVESLDFPASRINFEVTENLFIHNLAQVSSVLKQLQEMGFSIHLDDFGTGYSSLSYLTELPFDVIKIDRSFVHKLGSLNDTIELLDSMISIGRNMKKEVIAEGIETEEQASILQDMNCAFGQGFLFSPPQTGPDLENGLRNWPYRRALFN